MSLHDLLGMPSILGCTWLPVSQTCWELTTIKEQPRSRHVTGLEQPAKPKGFKAKRKAKIKAQRKARIGSRASKKC